MTETSGRLQNGKSRAGYDTIASRSTSQTMTRPSPPEPIDPIRPRLDPEPTHQPEPHFWPYVDLPQQPTEDEIAAMDPDLRRIIFGTDTLPFSITIVFPVIEGPEHDRAVALAKASRGYREVGAGRARRIWARYQPEDVDALRTLYQLVGSLEGSEVLIDERPVPYARELWLPLLWYLLPR
jgi:hypothetical protein